MFGFAKRHRISFVNYALINDVQGLTIQEDFKPAFYKYVIFANNNIESVWSEFFDIYYKKISDYFHLHGFKFICMPNFFSDKESKEIDYNTGFNIQDSRNSPNLIFDKLSAANPLLNCIIKELGTSPGLVYYWGLDNDRFYLSKYYLPLEIKPSRKYKRFWNVISDYIIALNKYIIKGDMTVKSHSREITGLTYSYLTDLNFTIAKLRRLGLTRAIINQALGAFRTFSYLVITSDNRIMLPFLEVEIKLSPLPKTLYFLFLRHPEGIVLKNIIDYKSELRELYLMISPAENLAKINNSIDKLCNPLDNSINEKCSRIREAFLKHFEEDFASWYIITGNAGEIRTVMFDRNFVQWNVDWEKEFEAKSECFSPLIMNPQALLNSLKKQNSN